MSAVYHLTARHRDGGIVYEGPVTISPAPFANSGVCALYRDGREYCSSIQPTAEAAVRELFPAALHVSLSSTLAHLLHTFADNLMAYTDGTVTHMDIRLLQTTARFLADEIDQLPTTYGQPPRLEE